MPRGSAAHVGAAVCISVYAGAGARRIRASHAVIRSPSAWRVLYKTAFSALVRSPRSFASFSSAIFCLPSVTGKSLQSEFEIANANYSPNGAGLQWTANQGFDRESRE